MADMPLWIWNEAYNLYADETVDEPDRVLNMSRYLWQKVGEQWITANELKYIMADVIKTAEL